MGTGPIPAIELVVSRRMFNNDLQIHAIKKIDISVAKSKLDKRRSRFI